MWVKSYVANVLSSFGLPGRKQHYSSTTNQGVFLHDSLDGSNDGFH